MSEYFRKLKSFGGRVKVRFIKLCNKRRFKNVTGLDTSDFVKKTDLTSLKPGVDILDFNKLKNVLANFSNLKSKVDKSDIDQLVPVPVDLSKLSDVVKNIVKKIYIMLR